MAVSLKAFIMVVLVALCLTVVAASDRQPLFDNHYSAGATTLPQRFQEMIQRRHLTQAQSYGRYGTYGVYGR